MTLTIKDSCYSTIQFLTMFDDYFLQDYSISVRYE